MGWLEGLLTGYQQRHYDIEATKRREAELAAQREGRVFETLLNSKYRDVQALAGAGLMEASKPRQKRGGIAGWMGEMQTSPYMAAIQRYQSMLDPDDDDILARTSTDTAGAISTPPAPTGSAAMPATAQTTPGSPPLTPTQPTPTPSAAASAPPAPPAAPPPAPPGPYASGGPENPMLPWITPHGTAGLSEVAKYGPRQVTGPEAAPPPTFPELQGVSTAGFPNQGPVLSPLAPGQTQPQLAPGAAGGPPAAPAAAPAAAQGAGAAGMTSTPAGTQPATGLPQPGASATPPPAPPTPQAQPVTPGQLPGAQAPMPAPGPPPAPPIPATALTTNLSGAPPPRPRRTTLLPTVHPGGRSVFPSTADLTEQREEAEVAGLIKGWQRMYRENGDADWQQKGIQAALNQKLGRSAQAPYQSVEIEYKDASGRIVKTLGMFDKAAGRYVDFEGKPIPAANIVRSTPASSLSMGQFANRAMNALHVTALDVRNDPALAARVVQLANQYQQEAAYSSGIGGGLAEYDSPLTIPQAQAARLPVGTRAARLNGQIIPTAQQTDRRTMLGVMSEWLTEIESKLGVLPKLGDLGNYAPGAAVALYRMHPDYREGFAELDASINQIMASLSRVVQNNVGTQTEQDAMRAQETLAMIKGRLLDPMTGDTQESARARLAETKLYLQQVLQTLPAVPVPTAAPNPLQGGGAPGAAAGTGGPAAGATPGAPDPLLGTAAPSDIPSTGAFVRNGRRYWNGKDIGPVK